MRNVAHLFTILAALGSTSLAAQAHATHRHPSGAKIIMTGVLVEPLCHSLRDLLIQPFRIV